MGLLPEGLPHPEFLGHYDQGDWIALVFSDVDGRHPHLPWRSNDLTRVLDTVYSFTQTPLNADALELLPHLGIQRAYSFQGWDRLRDDHDESLDPWAVSNFDALADLSKEASSSVVGNSLVHTDLRADNLLLTEDGSVTVVDWPWAAIGARWFDALTILIDVRVYDPNFDVEVVIAQHPVFSSATHYELNTAIAGLAGYFIDAARQTAPQGIPTLRSFQKQEGIAALNWLKERL
jgi:aminoglycoside phosphotransferase (APT) family kinase protein